MAVHEHVQVLVHCVLCEGAGGVGGAGYHIGVLADLDDVGGVAPTSSLTVIGMDCSALESCDGVLQAAALVQRVGVESDRNVLLLRQREAGVNCGGRGAPVLVELEPHRPCCNDVFQALGRCGVALPSEAKVHRNAVCCPEHHAHVGWGRGAGCGTGSRGRSGASAEQCSEAAGNGLAADPRADEVHVHVQAARGQDQPLPGDGLGGSPDNQGRVHRCHGVRVASLANPGNDAILDADVCLVYSGVVHHQRIGDDEVQAAVGAEAGRLPHTLPQHLASSKLAFVPVHSEVLLDLQEQRCVAELNPVSGGGAIHRGVLVARELQRRALLDGSCLRLMQEGAFRNPLHGQLQRGVVQRPICQAVASADDLVAGNLHQSHCLHVPGLEAHGCAGGNVQPLSKCQRPVELEVGVGLPKVKV
mmetsp:Transcript_17477/g.48748  ORF Transcript_17477/g.48748 Transcript_17477/m.48748 type:complete len:417 (-) Transcript_17477:586-1836(-)